MKTWADLLWLHLTGQLTDAADRQAFETYLEQPRYRDELAEWEILDDAVETEVAERVDALPPLTEDFLANLPDQRTLYTNGHAQNPAPFAPFDGPRPLSDTSEAEPMIQTDSNSITLPDDRKPITLPRVRVSLPLVAAVTAIIVIGGLLFASINAPPPEDDVTAAGIEEEIEAQNSPTPAPSQTPNLTRTLEAVPPLVTAVVTPTPEADLQTATAIIAQATQTMRDLTATATPITSDTDGTVEAAVQRTLTALPIVTRYDVPESTGCSMATVTILEPVHGAVLSPEDPLTVTISAYDSGLEQYELAIRPPSADEFIPVEVDGNFSDTITDFYTEPGLYDIRIQAFYPATEDVQTCQITVIIDDGSVATSPDVAVATQTSTMTPTHTATPQNTVTNTATASPTFTPSATFTPTAAISQTPVICITHTVLEGDTLLGIAVTYNVPAADLLAANGIDDPDTYTLMVGETLIIPGDGCVLQRTGQATAIVMASASPVPSATHTMTPTLPPGSGVATMAVSPVPPTALPPGFAVPTITSTPIPFSTPVATVPRPDPRASITPSQIEPIIAAPATLNETLFLPGGDFSSSVAWSPDGETIAAAAYTGVWLLDADDLTSPPRLLPDPSGEGLMSVAFSPDGELLVTFGWDGTTRIWDVETGQQRIELPEAGLWNDAYFIDERSFASTGSSRRVDIIDLDADPPEVVIDDSSRLNVLFIHLPDDRIALDFDGNLSVESINNRVPILNIEATPTSMILNDAGTQLAITTATAQVLLVDLETLTMQRARFGGLALDVEFNPAGDQIAVSVNQSDLKVVELWQPEDDTRTPIVVYDVIIGDVAFSPAGDQLIATASDGRLILLNLE